MGSRYRRRPFQSEPVGRRHNHEMSFYPVFLSVVCVLRNEGDRLAGIVGSLRDALLPLVTDYELIIVDNASGDHSLKVLQDLTGDVGEPNLQVYALTKEVDVDTATWVGLENALGDFVVVIDPLLEDIQFLPEMLERAVTGADVVFASNKQRPQQNFAYRAAFAAFNAIYRSVGGIDLVRDAPHYRILSKRMVSFILQHPQPAITYRHLPATAGFRKANLTYVSAPKVARPKNFAESMDRGMRLLVSTTRTPMRLVTWLSLFGAVANLVYSFYVVAIALFKQDVAPGWTSLSLQQSGMFLLFSLVLLVLGEYMLQMAALSNEGPLYHVGQEFTSRRLTRREKLNLEEASPEVFRTKTESKDLLTSTAQDPARDGA
jgi:polyisoprenyl-phosphate glycosyltransferase